MPEITDQPKTAGLVANEKQTPLLAETYAGFFDPNDQGATPDSALVKLRVFYFNDLIRKSHPNVPENVIENICNLYTGPLALKPETLQSSTKEQEEKELSARIQHHFTHLIVYASQKDADPKLQERLYGLLSGMEKSSRNRLGKDLKILQFLNGIRSEVAIIKTLIENDYSVIIPDYLVKSDPQKRTTSEVYDWDVKAGIDLIAISPKGTFYLIDAKGKKFVENPNRDKGTEPSQEDINRETNILLNDVNEVLPDSLSSVIREACSSRGISKPQIKRARVVVPTSEEEMGGLKNKHDENLYREVFQEYGNLNLTHKTDIINALK